MKTYETMFLVDAGNHDFEAASAPVREVLNRIEAEVLSMKPWDERRLAYKIKGRKRGLYVLTYFKADPARIDELEHDIQLNDRVLRAMVLSGDHLSDDQINADTPATLADARRTAAEAEREAAASAEQVDSDEQTPEGKTAEPEDAPQSPDPADKSKDDSGQTESIEDNTTDADEPVGEITDPDPDSRI